MASEPHYTITTRLDDRPIGFQKIEDPFVTSTTVIGRRDLLRGLLRGSVKVTVLVDGDRETVAAVMRLKRETPDGD